MVVDLACCQDKLMPIYKDRLVSAAISVANGFRLELQDRNFTVELPEVVMGLLAKAESFNLAGNQFSNIHAGTVLYDMVYTMKRWLHAKFDWRGRRLTGFDGLAGVLHTGEFLAPGMDTGSEISIEKLRGKSELDLSGRNIGSQAAAVIASLIATNTELQTLNISKNNLEAEGAKHVAEAIKHCELLTQLDISANKLTRGARKGGMWGLQRYEDDDQAYESDMSGIVKLAGALQDSNLQSLDISENELRAEGAKHIAEATKHCESLATIIFGDGQSAATLSVNMADADISGKRIGAGGAIIAAEFMKRMT